MCGKVSLHRNSIELNAHVRSVRCLRRTYASDESLEAEPRSGSLALELIHPRSAVRADINPICHFCCSESIPLSTKANDTEWPFLQHAQFTPEGHSLIMVRNYDIYYTQLSRSPLVYRVTRDAVPGVVQNGIPDWLYEGECSRIGFRLH